MHAVSIFGLLITQCALATALQTLYVYGDSISDPGMTYKVTSGAWPPPPNAKKNSNGDVWVEYAARTAGYEVVGLARGGATTNNTVVMGYTGTSDMRWTMLAASDQAETQMTVFRWESPPFTNASPDRTGDVHLVCVGSNDVFFQEEVNGLPVFMTQWKKFMNASVDAIANTARYLLDNDNVQDVKICDTINIYDVPLAHEQGSLVMNFLKQILTYVSTEVQSKVDELQLEYPDKSVGFIPIKATMEAITKTFKNQTSGCLDYSQGLDKSTTCTDVENYMWWDLFHPTTLGHQKIAAELSDTLFG